MNKSTLAIILAVFAAALYALNVPLSKLFLVEVPATMMAGLLYLGAGLGVGLILLGKQFLKIKDRAPSLDKKDLPYTVAMVVLDIGAPILLMYGLKLTSSANASLLNNFEIVATSVIALVLFQEKISKDLWSAILLVTLASVILSFEGEAAFTFNEGSLLVLAAAICWGFENNCTRSLSEKSSEQIVLIKGIFSGLGSLMVAFGMGEKLPEAGVILRIMLLGFVAYGLSINLYIRAQKYIGAAKTSAFYSVAPFLGVGFSFLFLGEEPRPSFYLGLLIMGISTVLMVKDTLQESFNEDKMGENS